MKWIQDFMARSLPHWRHLLAHVRDCLKISKWSRWTCDVILLEEQANAWGACQDTPNDDKQEGS